MSAASKSTTVSILTGLLEPSGGTVLLDGCPVRDDLLAYKARIGYVPEDRRVFADLTIEENLEVAERPGGPWTRQAVYELFQPLLEFRTRRGGLLSGGQQQMLTIARTLMGNPELLLLDEPSEGLAPLIVELLQQRVAELKATGLSIVLAEQNLQFVMALADRVYILEKGEVRFTGTPADLKADEGIVHQYLTV